MESKIQYLSLIIILFAITIGGISVSGIIQSTERVSSSGIVVVAEPEPIIFPPSTNRGGGSSSNPLPSKSSINLDIYSDKECTKLLSQINWGNLEAGSQNSVVIYVKNNDSTSPSLSLSSNNWKPSGLQNYLNLDWDYSGKQINPGMVTKITITLWVNENCPNVSSFNFNILILATS